MSMCVGRAGVGLVRGMRVTVIFICVCVLGMCVFVSVDVFLDVYVCGVGLVRGMGVTDTTLVATTASHHLRAWELKAWVTLWSSDVHRLYEVHTTNVR